MFDRAGLLFTDVFIEARQRTVSVTAPAKRPSYCDKAKWKEIKFKAEAFCNHVRCHASAD